MPISRVSASGLELHTLGATMLRTADGATLPLRRKDLALLVYLCLERRRTHARGRLATLCWGDVAEAHARHSLTQTLRRLRQVLGAAALEVTAECVEWRGEVACDAIDLLEPAAELRDWDLAALAELRPDEFLADLALGPGGHDFDAWADERRAELRVALVRLLNRLGSRAEREGRWSGARDLGLLLTQVEPIYESAHRRVMLAWSALGERMLALRHYERFVRWLAEEHDESPDPRTVALAQTLRTGATPPLPTADSPPEPTPPYPIAAVRAPFTLPFHAAHPAGRPAPRSSGPAEPH